MRAGVLPLLPETVHIWTAHVSAHAVRETALAQLLDADELHRAHRFHFAEHRTQYVVAHGLLRVLLGAYMNVPPASIRFERSEYGKPHIIGPAAPGFNLSHAGDIVVIAVCADRPVGVDVEQWIDVEYDDLSESFFSPVEQQALRGLTLDQKTAGFFACWTRKEAYIKATGLGVSHGLDYFDVSLAEGVPAQLLADRNTGRSWRDWSMTALLMPPGYSGAVVAEGTAKHTEQWKLMPEDVAL